MRSPAEQTPSTEERNRKKNDTQERITQMKGPASAGLKEKRSNPLFFFLHLRNSLFRGEIMYHIGICDDGKNICAELEEMILQYASERRISLEVETWYSGEDVCRYLEEECPLDILFLDIELLSMSGVLVAEFIRSRLENRWMQIIYISGNASHAQKLFKTQPMDFLVKPITRENVQEALDLAIKILDKRKRRFEYRSGKEYHYVPFGDILYFGSEGRKIIIKTLRGEETFYGNLKKIEQELPPDFIGIHQSYIINHDFVARYAYDSVELLDGTCLPISKSNRKKVRERILREDDLHDR